MSPHQVSIAQIVAPTSAEGPGLRAAIWVQGCSIQCKGCFNKHLWPIEGGDLFHVDDLVEKVMEHVNDNPEIEGITLLGGEPFNQALALSSFAKSVHEIGLSVMVFTGFTHEYLIDSGNAVNGYLELLSNTDLLVDGPYIASEMDFKRPWVGSKNQRFIFLSDRYNQEDLAQPDRIELRVTDQGVIKVNGWDKQSSTKSLISEVTVAILGSECN
jgi:anaerobic ribonucleoside-triphosphate reductase activating protein